MVKAHQKASLQQVLQLSGSSRELVRSSRDFTYLLLSQCLPIPKTDLTFFYQMIYLKQKEKNAVQKYRNKLKVTKPNENITNLFYTQHKDIRIVLKLMFYYFQLCVCVPMCGHVRMRTQRPEAPGPLEVELQAVLSHLTRVLGTLTQVLGMCSELLSPLKFNFITFFNEGEIK